MEKKHRLPLPAAAGTRSAAAGAGELVPETAGPVAGGRAEILDNVGGSGETAELAASAAAGTSAPAGTSTAAGLGRDRAGRFVKGMSGNPVGRPAGRSAGRPKGSKNRPKLPVSKEELDQMAGLAIRFLIETIRNEDAAIGQRIDCAKTVLDRVYGKSARLAAAEALDDGTPAAVGSDKTAKSGAAEEIEIRLSDEAEAFAG